MVCFISAHFNWALLNFYFYFPLFLEFKQCTNLTEWWQTGAGDFRGRMRVLAYENGYCCIKICWLMCTGAWSEYDFILWDSGCHLLSSCLWKLKFNYETFVLKLISFSLPCLCVQVEDWKVRLRKLFNLFSSLMVNVLQSISDWPVPWHYWTIKQIPMRRNYGELANFLEKAEN